MSLLSLSWRKVAIVCLFALRCDSAASKACCPHGWSYEPATIYSCGPPDEFVDDLGKRIGSGTFGMVKVITGACGLCGDSCDCTCEFPTEHSVYAYSSEAEFAEYGNPSCASQDLPVEKPVTSTSTDASGTYELALEPGSYFLATEDPVENCINASQLVVEQDEVVHSGFVFDYGDY